MSFDTGAGVVKPTYIADKADVLPVKPFPQFIATTKRRIQQPMPVAVIGAGAAGVELALALAKTAPEVTLISSGHPVPETPNKLQVRVRRQLRQAGICLITHTPVDCITADGAYHAGRCIYSGRRFILATGAAALTIYQNSGLQLDSKGFIRILPTLQSISHPQVFATGDCASLPEVPKSGVFAIRQGEILAHNLIFAMTNQPLKRYIPQPHALILLADGRGGALAAWRGLTAQGRWCGWWKTVLDARYLHSMKTGQ